MPILDRLNNVRILDCHWNEMIEQNYKQLVTLMTIYKDIER